MKIILLAVLLSLGISRGPENPPTLRMAGSPRAIELSPVVNPRPAPGAEHVPLRSSLYMMIESPEPGDRILPESVAIGLSCEGGEAVEVLRPGGRFNAGFTGRLREQAPRDDGAALLVYVERDAPLEPETTYRVHVEARSKWGGTLPKRHGAWRFTTEAAPDTHRLHYALDFGRPADVRWTGAFFNGFAKPSFATSTQGAGRVEHYAMMAEARKEFPRAWNLLRDAYLTGFAYQPNFFKAYPNIVREKETRRITAIARRNDHVLLTVEDFFGHPQYGIASDRPLSGDYHKGDEILIADGRQSARARLLDTDDAGAVRVTAFAPPPEPWRIDYARSLPTNEDPDAPGLFPSGGTYLRKFDPPGTACYYWGRLHHEWDLIHGRYGLTPIPRFADAPGDLSIDGNFGTTAKDLVQLHEVTRTIASHVIERYGEATVDWPWVVFNEPDLMSHYWRCRDWEELQRFYDYSSDAILRAFEDHGYDARRVRVGGLELGAIFGDRLRLHDFLAHVSPNATRKGALEKNAAFADPRLDGKRSARVEALCEANDGRGAPFDFLSVHTYNHAEMAARKLIRAKEIALQIDPVYFEKLPVVSHETVPAWRPIPDPGAAEIYLGNGYFPTWAAHFQARLLQRGADDPRHAYGGELVLMGWPHVQANFDAMNDVVRRIQLPGRSEVIPCPIFHFVNLLSTMQGEFRVLAPEWIGGHAVGGFATTTGEELRILLYAHHPQDTQSRSDIAFEAALDLLGLPWQRVEVEAYRFDRSHNSYYELARQMRRQRGPQRHQTYSEEEFERIADQARLRVTRRSVLTAASDGSMRWTAQFAGNGGNFIIVRPTDERRREEDG
jgi:hypothetical protein